MNGQSHKGSYLSQAVDHHYEDHYLAESKLFLLYLYGRQNFERKSQNKAAQYAYVERIHEEVDRSKVRIVKLGEEKRQSCRSEFDGKYEGNLSEEITNAFYN